MRKRKTKKGFLLVLSSILIGSLVFRSVSTSTASLTVNDIVNSGIKVSDYQDDRSSNGNKQLLSLTTGRTGPKDLSTTTSRPDEKEVHQRLVLHIGPHKTASSTIQCKLTFLKKMLRNNLDHQNQSALSRYEYIGRLYRDCHADDTKYTIDTRRIIQCLDSHTTDEPCSDTQDWKNFESVLKKLARKNVNVVLSDEAFSRISATEGNLALLHSTLSRHFSVQVVIVYRRYWEWLLSMYNEKYKPLSRRKKYQTWPDDGGTALQSFPHYYRQLQQGQGISGYQLLAETQNIHAVAYLKGLFGKHFDNVVIFDMHQEGSLLDNFFRQILSGAKNVLQKYKDHLPKRPNPSLNLNYDMLAVAARNNGLLRSSLSRVYVSKAVKKRLSIREQTLNSTAIECLDPIEEAALLNRSLYLEQLLFPDDANQWVEQHRSEFAAYTLRFCNVDANKVLTDSAWQQFFQSL